MALHRTTSASRLTRASCRVSRQSPASQPAATMAAQSREDAEVINIINTLDSGQEEDGEVEAEEEEQEDEEDDSTTDSDGGNSKVKDVLEKLSGFLKENNLEKQIKDDREKILRKIANKNEEIFQKNETHRHKLCELKEAYKLEIQRENERHVLDLKVTETAILKMKSKLDELEKLNYNYNMVRQMPAGEEGGAGRATASTGRLKELLECPVGRLRFACTNLYYVKSFLFASFTAGLPGGDEATQENIPMQ